MKTEREYGRMRDRTYRHPQDPDASSGRTPDCYPVSITADTRGHTVNKSIGVEGGYMSARRGVQ